MVRFINLISIVAACGLISYSGAASACDTTAVKINIEWLSHNNSGAYSRIAGGCQALKGTVDSGVGLQNIVDGYKGGQSHDPSAAAAIDGCTAIQLLQLCP